MDMSAAMDDLGAAAALLALLMWFCGMTTVYVRGRVMESPNREDAMVMTLFNRVVGNPPKNLVALEGAVERDALVNRWRRIADNNVANIPAALLVFFFAAQQDALGAGLLTALIWLFVAARFAFVFFYARAMQPFRTLAFVAGVGAMAIAAIALLVRCRLAAGARRRADCAEFRTLL